MMPMTGFHSVIDRPERVSRVIPPTTTIGKISAQHRKSHAATATEPLPLAAPSIATPERVAVAVEIDKPILANAVIGQGETAFRRWQVRQDAGFRT